MLQNSVGFSVFGKPNKQKSQMKYLVSVCASVCVCMVINQGRDNVAGRGHLMTAAASKSEEREGTLPHSIFSLGLCLCLFLGSRVYFKFIRKGEAAHLCTTGLAT